MYLPSAEPSRFEWRQEYYFRSAWAISNRSHIISTAAGVLTLRLDVVVSIIIVAVVAIIFVEVVEVVVAVVVMIVRPAKSPAKVISSDSSSCSVITVGDINLLVYCFSGLLCLLILIFSTGLCPDLFPIDHCSW